MCSGRSSFVKLYIIFVQFYVSAVCDRSAVAVLRPLVPSMDIILPALVAIKRAAELMSTGCFTNCRKHLTSATHLRNQTSLLLVSVKFLVPIGTKGIHFTHINSN